MEWPQEMIDRLKFFWSQTKTVDEIEVPAYSTNKIAEKLKVSKNAIVGKVHRLNLPPRPSPIKTGQTKPENYRPIPQPPRNTLPPLPSFVAPVVIRRPPAAPKPTAARATLPPLQSATSRTTLGEAVAQQFKRIFPETAPEPQPYKRPSRYADGTGCSWPIGEPGTKQFRYCDDDLTSQDNRTPYCTEHYHLSRVRVRRREDVAA